MDRCLEFDGNRAVPNFPSNFVFVLMDKVASLGHLMKKNGEQAAQFFREFDGNLVDGCFPSNSSLISKKQAGHILQRFDGNTGNCCFPSKFCLLPQKQAAQVCRNGVGNLTISTVFTKIRHVLAILLNLRAVLHPTFCLFSRDEHEIRRNPALQGIFVELPKNVLCLF